MFENDQLLILNLLLFSSLTLLIEFFIASRHFLLRQPVFAFNPFFDTRLPVALAVIFVGGVVAVLGLIPVGIYASQGINDGLIFLIFCLLPEIVIMKWLISWYRKLILEGSEKDWNKRIVFLGYLFFLNCFLLWLYYV